MLLATGLSLGNSAAHHTKKTFDSFSLFSKYAYPAGNNNIVASGDQRIGRELARKYYIERSAENK